ncbi:MAG: DUF4359 domain-containing protein [Scytonema sp. PMC 1069.18]|nr:DUF4359 domain-containing protein [Scytonema sp. PMC 1069.18]MEC4883777.1 DUF4359 domain-containing protein [Scytonema sp. PMC 1070.18]
MKFLAIMTFVGVLGLSAVGLAMAKTNPDQEEYEQYAVQQLSDYLKSNVCKKAPNLLENIIKFNCAELVESANPQIKEIISASTEKQDFIIFSVYRTDLTLNNWIPSYKFETVAAFDNFYTYSVEKQ